MRFYRRLLPVKAMTFDLDDTLYDNRPVMSKTLAESHAFLQSRHPALRNVTPADYQKIRDSLLQQEPEIYHDVTEWRRRAVVQMMLSVGLDMTQAQKQAQQVMAVFAHWRSRINVPDETHKTLAALAEHIPLAAITNGNAQPHLFGLESYFQFILRAGADGRAKPWRDMYLLAAARLNVAPEAILHVGDDLTTDVAGSLRCGMQACWINLRGETLYSVADTRLLPHVEISQLASLTALI